jgi:hypothetical protein
MVDKQVPRSRIEVRIVDDLNLSDSCESKKDILISGKLRQTYPFDNLASYSVGRVFQHRLGTRVERMDHLKSFDEAQPLGFVTS